MKSYITLEHISFYAYHGASEQERIVGNNYEVSLTIELPLSEAMESDRLESTVNYADLYEIIKSEMQIPSKLIEHVAGRIVRHLQTTFPSITQIDLTLTKCNPPIIGDVKKASVRIIV